jgi:hypothetical protein
LGIQEALLGDCLHASNSKDGRKRAEFTWIFGAILSAEVTGQILKFQRANGLLFAGTLGFAFSESLQPRDGLIAGQVPGTQGGGIQSPA